VYAFRCISRRRKPRLLSGSEVWCLLIRSRQCHSGDVSADNDCMDERHRLATDIAKYFLASHREPPREDSRLFEDLQQFALEVLKTVRSRDTVPQAVDQKGTRLPGEIRGYWSASRPVHLCDCYVVRTHHGYSRDDRG